MLSIINTLNLNSIEIPSWTVHSTMAHSLILHYAFGNSEMGYEWAWFFSTLQNTILSIRQCRQTPLTDVTQTAMDYIKKQACTRAVCHFTFHVSSMWRCWKEHRTGEEDYVTRDDDQSSQCCYESKAVKPWVETWESRFLKKSSVCPQIQQEKEHLLLVKWFGKCAVLQYRDRLPENENCGPCDS